MQKPMLFSTKSYAFFFNGFWVQFLKEINVL